MRAVIFFLVLVFAAGCKPKDSTSTVSPRLVADQTDSSQLTTIEWKESSINYGKITEGQKLEVSFHFKNTGTKPLVIKKVVPGCGCTIAETPSEPISPGEEGVIKATFDSRNRVGTQHKTIFVDANTSGKQQHELVFEVEVGKSG